METLNKVQKRNDYYTTVGDDIKGFIEGRLNGCPASDLYWGMIEHKSRLSNVPGHFRGIVNLFQLNNYRRINKFLEKANQALDEGDYMVICMETMNTRRKRIFQRYASKIAGYLVYLVDFIVHRVFPKLKYTKKLYFRYTNGSNRALSLTEGLGRLISCGFEIVDYEQIGTNTVVISRKVKEPVYDMEPTYGALVKLNRIGYKGNEITLYKLRTMHPYSEYVQKYIYDKYGTKDGDKIRNDFRVTGWGRILRSVWVDELPMLYNFLKGDVKLVGVRPLSRHKFNTYPEYLQKKRIKTKPGLVPPYYADLPDTVEEFYETEERYLDAYFKNPWLTDIKYFFKALYNIVFRRARSK